MAHWSYRSRGARRSIHAASFAAAKAALVSVRNRAGGVSLCRGQRRQPRDATIGPRKAARDAGLDRCRDLGPGSQGDQIDVLAQPGVRQVGARQGSPAEEHDVVGRHSTGDRRQDVREEVVATDLLDADAEPFGDRLELVVPADAQRPAATRA